jgi:F-type H+-transporting ATPase subunit a
MNFHKSLLVAALIAAPSIALAQKHATPRPARPAAQVIAPNESHPAPGLDTIPAAGEKKGEADMIMPHITDSKHVELPWVKGWNEWNYEWTLPTWNVNVGGRVIDMGPTKHVFFMGIAALLTCLLVIGLARAHARRSREIGRPQRFAAGFEALILYLRNEVYMKALGGHGGAAYVPFVLTLLFFIIFCNVLGLMPWGSTPTANIAVTGTLAVITLFVVEIAGIKALGAGYIKTIIYWPHDLHVGGKVTTFLMKVVLTLILSPIELMGKLTKPFALTMRLFANMVAGHVVLLAFVGMMFTFGIWGFPALIMATIMMFLEMFVALLQAFIFSMLAAVFIGQIRAAHH